MDTNKNESFQYLSLDKVLADRFGRYSKYIIQDRALPDARDGLKPVQRRILFSMHELGLLANKPFKKSARVVGEVIGKYHPHGDTSIYDALTRMSQKWKINMPLVEMHGNNGSIDDDPAAAMRYTEVRLSKITGQILNGIKKKPIPFAPNFDDSEIEPTVLPSLLPNLLVNGAKGIAAGYATEIPPHNLNEIIDTIIAKIKSPNIRLNTILKFINGPDFPTGGVVQGKSGIFEAFERGKGKIIIRSKCLIKEINGKPNILITEIPYGVVKSKLVREIDELRFNNKVNGIRDVRDESDRNGIMIKIKLEKDIKAEAVLNYLLAKTELQIYYNYNVVAIKNKAPRQMGLLELIETYLDHQKIVITKSLNFDLHRAQKRLEIINGFIEVAKISDQIINAIRKTSGGMQQVIIMLQKKFQFTPLQAEAIAKLQLYRLSQTDQIDYDKEKTKLEIEISKNQAILSSRDNFNKYLITLLKDLKRDYGIERKTKIKAEIEQIKFNIEALIRHEDTWIGITRQGYIKRFSNRVYETNNFEKYKIRDDDALEYMQHINTQNKVLIFTNKGNFIALAVHEIIESKFRDIGVHINDFATLQENELVIGVVAIKNFDANAYVTLISAKGKGKRVNIKDFQKSRYSKTNRAMKLAPKDYLRAITISNGYKQLVVIARNGFANKYSETQLPVQKLGSSGLKAIDLTNSEVASVASGTNDEVLGIVSNRGGMKRIKMESILPMGRTTAGAPLYRTIKGKSHIVVDSRTVLPDTSVIFSNETFEKYQFKQVGITSQDSGLSLIAGNNNGALINNYETIASDNPYFEKPNIQTDEEKFDEAEATIDSASQISIDELLEKLK